MPDNATLEKLKRLKLPGMARALQEAAESRSIDDLDRTEFLAWLVDRECDDRETRRLQRLLSRANLRYRAVPEEIDWKIDRHLEKKAFSKFLETGWLEKHRNIIIAGPTGAGKSYLACALGHQTCRHGYTTAYFNTNKLLAQLREGQADNSVRARLRRLQGNRLLILDDFGLQKFDALSRLWLLEIVEDRYERASTIITTQIPVGKWHEVIGDETIADAVCDRLIHNAERIDLQGESVRKSKGEGLR